MTKPDNHSRSIAKSLAIWYALLSSILVITFSVTMHSVLKDRMRSDDDQVLVGRIAEIKAILAQYGNDYNRLREEITREANASPGFYLRLMDDAGTVVAQGGGSMHNFSDTAAFASTQATGVGYDWVTPDGRIIRVVTTKFLLGSNFTVHAAMDLSDDEELLEDYWRALALVGFAALAIAVAMGYGIARNGLRPISKLADIVDQLDARGLHRRVSEDPWPKELQPLARKFDSLLSRLENSFARLSQFSADIAHELRTPLHILRGEAELVLTRDSSVEAYRACIESTVEEYERLSRMVEGLLFLARSEQPNAHLAIQQLDIAQECAAVCDFYQAMADEQGVELLIQASGHVCADADLLRRALANLVGNAISHTSSGGQVNLGSSINADGAVEISVSDTGCGISPEHLSHIFDRFYRVDDARQQQGQSMGLGLAIVRSIMQLHHGTASIQSELGRGTTIALIFPA